MVTALEERKPRFTKISVDRGTYERLRNLAQAKGMTASGYLREISLSDGSTKPLPDRLADMERKLDAALLYTGFYTKDKDGKLVQP